MYKSGRSAAGFGAILHVMTPTEVPLTELAELYRDLHAHPELSFQETPTAGIVADRLAALSYRVHTGIGGTGVVGVLACGHDVHVTCLLGAAAHFAAHPDEVTVTLHGRGGHGSRPETTVDPVVMAAATVMPCCFWFLGGADPALFADVSSLEEAMAVIRRIPSNHSPQYAPVIEPTLSIGVEALVRAARNWLSGN